MNFTGRYAEGHILQLTRSSITQSIHQMTGKISLKEEPTFGSLVAQINPLWLSITLPTMNKPIPEPL